MTEKAVRSLLENAPGVIVIDHRANEAM